ncbi:MAG TPA: HEAT repeat domain-containing protein [Vicinamibacterales bacterium]|nr:HEAT repeat domain-containing protein [Vicinamibacterales bacterium]
MKLRMLLLSLIILVAASHTTGASELDRHRSGWISWNAPVVEGIRICCNWQKGGCCGSCVLGGSHGMSMTDDDELPGGGTREMLIVARLADGVMQKVHVYDAGCPLDTRGTQVTHVANVSVEESLDYLMRQIPNVPDESSVIAALAQHRSANVPALLERLAGNAYVDDVREDALFWLGNRGGERGFRFLRDFVRGNEKTSLRKKAVFALTQSESEGAVPELISLARNHNSREIRREAIFWLGQKAGEKAANELRRAVDEDPDDDVREHAVFAISQLPRERAVPLLIDLARNHKSPKVREKAIFWLVQTGDERALAVIEEILSK